MLLASSFGDCPEIKWVLTARFFHKWWIIRTKQFIYPGLSVNTSLFTDKHIHQAALHTARATFAPNSAEWCYKSLKSSIFSNRSGEFERFQARAVLCTEKESLSKCKQVYYPLKECAYPASRISTLFYTLIYDYSDSVIAWIYEAYEDHEDL